jgi:hypothetical protein
MRAVGSGNRKHGDALHRPTQANEALRTPRLARSKKGDQVHPDFHYSSFHQDPFPPSAFFLWDNEPGINDPRLTGLPDTACAALDAAMPAEGSPGFVDPFHFDWPYW